MGKIEKTAWIAIMASSAVAVVFLNSLAFGFSQESVYDSLVHTFFVATSVSVFIISAAPRLEWRPFWTRVLLIAAGIVPTTIAGVFLATIFLQFVNPYDRPYSQIPSARTVLFSLVISYIFGLGGYLYLYSRGKLRAAKEEIREKADAEQRARTLASEAKFASLESRIRPHFLFNTLNSIAALIREDPTAAERMVEQLSNILRFSLDRGPNRLNSLERELAITADYLEIQKSRFMDKLEYEFDIEETLRDFEVPTFAVQTLVDNSVKHVTGNNPGRTTINVSASSENGNVILSVKDNGGGFAPGSIKKGHGLDNLRERISVIYGGRASIRIEDSNGASVSIIIPKDG